MDCHDSGVFICICEILADVFQEELIRRRLHVRIHKRSEIKVRPSIKVELVFDELVHRGPVRSAVRYLKLWNVDARLVSGSICIVAMMRSNIIDIGSFRSGAFLEMANELIGIDLAVIVSSYARN